MNQIICSKGDNYYPFRDARTFRHGSSRFYRFDFQVFTKELLKQVEVQIDTSVSKPKIDKVKVKRKE